MDIDMKSRLDGFERMKKYSLEEIKRGEQIILYIRNEYIQKKPKLIPGFDGVMAGNKEKKEALDDLTSIRESFNNKKLVDAYITNVQRTW